MATTTVGKRWTLDHPELGTGPIPVAPYISDEYFAAMRDNVFKKVWMCTGKRVDEIPSPGDFFVHDIELVSASLIVVRGLDGIIRSHHNVCKHRGNKLTVEPRGNCKGKLVCSYHGWTYGIDGKLAVVTEREMFFDLDKKTCDLASVATDVWNGFIFINLDPEPKETLLEHMGGLTELFEGYEFDQLPMSFSYTAQLNACWAAARDSQLEGYHLKYLHKRTSPGVMAYDEDPDRHSLDFKLIGRHSVGSFYGSRSESKLAPVAQLAAGISQTLGSAATSLSDVNAWPKGLNPTRSKDWFFDVLYIFPNFHIVFLGSQAYIAHTFMPKAVDKSSWNARAYLPAPTSMVEQFGRESAKCSVRDLWLEDGSTLEGTQKNLESDVLKFMHVQDQEIMIRYADKVMNDMVGEW